MVSHNLLHKKLRLRHQLVRHDRAGARDDATAARHAHLAAVAVRVTANADQKVSVWVLLVFAVREHFLKFAYLELLA